MRVVAAAFMMAAFSACTAPDDKTSGPEPCSDAWLALVESRVPTGDGQGHGPDPGSAEWRSVVEFHLGLRDDPAVPDPGTSQWCAYIDNYLGNHPFE